MPSSLALCVAIVFLRLFWVRPAFAKHKIIDEEKSEEKKNGSYIITLMLSSLTYVYVVGLNLCI